MAQQGDGQADEYIDPPTSGSFLERYRLARTSSTPSSPAVAPAAAPPSPPAAAPPSPRSAARPKSGAAHVWGAVFHPLGRSPTSAARYDSPSVNHGEGGSISELHDEGRASANHIDRLRED
jgi:hypothetical protein